MYYHKIQTVYKRDPANKFRTLLEGEFAFDVFAYLANNEWLWTEKIDGTNTTVTWNGGDGVQFGGRTERSQIPVHLLRRLEGMFPVEKFDKAYPGAPMVLYGEGYGSKIQKVGKFYNPNGCDFILFDVRIGDVWLERQNVQDVAYTLGIGVVPIVGSGTLLDAVEFVKAGFKSYLCELPAEGVVARPMVDVHTRLGNRIITKVKAKDFNAPL